MHVTWNTVNHGYFPHSFENKDNIFWVELLSDLTYESCTCVDIAVNHILKTYDKYCSKHTGIQANIQANIGVTCYRIIMD